MNVTLSPNHANGNSMTGPLRPSSRTSVAAPTPAVNPLAPDALSKVELDSEIYRVLKELHLSRLDEQKAYAALVADVMVIVGALNQDQLPSVRDLIRMAQKNEILERPVPLTSPKSALTDITVPAGSDGIPSGKIVNHALAA